MTATLGELRFRRVTNVTALEIVAWRYGDSFARWNLSPPDVPRLLNANGGHFAVVDGRGSVVAAGCVGPEARVAGGAYEVGEPRVIDFTIRLRPSLLGRRLSNDLLRQTCLWLVAEHAPRILRVTVGENDRSAIRALERGEFAQTWAFASRERGVDSGRACLQFECSSGAISG